MSLHTCAALVERADPERFRAAMVAPVAARAVLFPLYAFNVEVSRAPWVTQEPMIAEMRLQWWRDVLEEIAGGGPVRGHEVVDALKAVLDPEAARLLDRLVAARRWDIYSDAFADAADLDDYIDATAGHLMWTAARLLGGAAEVPVRDFAFASGVSNLFRAIPQLQDKGRKPLVEGTQAGVTAFAAAAMDRLDRAKAARTAVSKHAASALYAGYAARPVLRQVLRDPSAVAAGALDLTSFAHSSRLLHVTLRGWWV